MPGVDLGLDLGETFALISIVVFLILQVHAGKGEAVLWGQIIFDKQRQLKHHTTYSIFKILNINKKLLYIYFKKHITTSRSTSSPIAFTAVRDPYTLNIIVCCRAASLLFQLASSRTDPRAVTGVASTHGVPLLHVACWGHGSWAAGV